MILPISNKINRLPEGEYSGTIKSISVGKTNKYVWFAVDVDDLNVTLNTSMNVDYDIYSRFISNFIDEKTNSVDSDDIIGQRICFSLIDIKINDEIYSKFSSINIKE